jgi:hypothetical protein
MRSLLAACLFSFCSLVAVVRAEDLSKLPDAISVKGGVTVATVQGMGAQIYACTKSAKGTLEWSFREPIAVLLQDGNTIGRHFVGPTWEFGDGTHVTAKPEGKAPGATPSDVAWLRLLITEPAKSGLASDATKILRIVTKGGAYSGACSKEGELHLEPYAATYIFVK